MKSEQIALLLNPPSEVVTERNALYRFFSADDRLLYIGITKDLGTRLKWHNLNQPWYGDVAYIKVEHFASRVEVELAEILAIKSERPRWNVVHNLPANPLVSLEDVVQAWDAVAEARERYRATLRGALANGVHQADIAKALGRTREMLRRDAMPEERREQFRQAENERLVRHRRR